MKIAVFSDTHGMSADMVAAVAENKPDAVIHCGDGCRDAREINDAFPMTPVYGVVGNCDYDPSLELARTIVLSNATIYISHGHMLGVRDGNLDRLVYAAQQEGANVALYGHTHCRHGEVIDGVAVINPGSAGMGISRSWCMLNIAPDGKVTWQFVDM